MGRGFNPFQALAKKKCRELGARGKDVREDRTKQRIAEWIEDRNNALTKKQSLTDKILKNG